MLRRNQTLSPAVHSRRNARSHFVFAGIFVFTAWLGLFFAAPAFADGQGGPEAASGACRNGASTNGASTNGAWAHSCSDLPPDPAVLFGTLPNGLRYAVMKNATPPGQASIRFRIGSGSLHESDEQQGLAHFLEHMAFKGSAHVPDGEMVKILQRKGLAFGPDTNASTEFTQTVYSLDLPAADPEAMQTGLMLMREAAGELTLAEAAMNSERGVVLSEERDRDTPQDRANKASCWRDSSPPAGFPSARPRSSATLPPAC